MLEYDIQLFWRRAKAWPALWGGPDEAYSLAAARRLAGRADAPARIARRWAQRAEGRSDRGLSAGRAQRRLPGRGPQVPRGGLHRGDARADARDRHPPRLGLPPGPGRARVARARMARRVRGAGPGRDGDGRLLRGVPAGRCPHLRGGHHAHDRERHPTPRHRGAEAGDPAARPAGRDHHRARLHRARVRLRRGRRPDPGGARRRRVGHQRAEDVHDQRAGRRLRLHAHPHQSRRGEAPGPDHLPGADAPGRRRGPAGLHPLGGADQRDLLLRRPRARQLPGRRGRRWLAGDDRRAHLRAQRGPGGRVHPGARRHGALGQHQRRRRRAPAIGGSRGAGTPRACRRRKRGERAPQPALRVDGAVRGAAGGGGLDGEAVRLGGDHAPVRATSSTCSVPTGSAARAIRRPSRAGRPSTPSGSPSAPPPTAAPARCSATSSPSADSGCPGPADARLAGPGPAPARAVRSRRLRHSRRARPR